ncbi:bile acid:sodium symporter family protein [Methanolobus halotolerans]|uniref:Bile acid:sodium symporter n=1 Tax=Methanolobus halotolerans TaxID=2052935 RepID=A0A4E0Q453_9EURY|nr:bile acid:sodium symporter family protein [Methanolobus halotolerans]TGC08437.1 bile acid:sodium symporter [Methanolobus halotolerans]
MLQRFTSLFPLWAVILSVVALFYPDIFLPYRDAIPLLLGIVMFGMGMTLSARDFLLVLKKPGVVLFGTAIQYTLMPLIGFVISIALSLPPELTAGVVLLGSCPGGTASNVICYLARGDVALSIVLTSVSTLLSFIATPLLTWLYIGQTVPVDIYGMVISILQIVIVPVTLGIGLNTFLDTRTDSFRHVFPAISVITIVIIIAIIMALNRDNVISAGLLVMSVTILHNLLGLASGYGLSRLIGLSETESRTITFEVGMQNSGLSVALAIEHFSAIAALPGALFSIWHNISGSFLASYWSERKEPEQQ